MKHRVLLGGYSSEVPPLPIPNREVKLTNADGTAYLSGRVGSRLFKEQIERFAPFFCWYMGSVESRPADNDTPSRACFNSIPIYYTYQIPDLIARSGLFIWRVFAKFVEILIRRI